MQTHEIHKEGKDFKKEPFKIQVYLKQISTDISA